jgi:hypothetical protein
MPIIRSDKTVNTAMFSETLYVTGSGKCVLGSFDGKVVFGGSVAGEFQSVGAVVVSEDAEVRCLQNSSVEGDARVVGNGILQVEHCGNLAVEGNAFCGCDHVGGNLHVGGKGEASVDFVGCELTVRDEAHAFVGRASGLSRCQGAGRLEMLSAGGDAVGEDNARVALYSFPEGQSRASGRSRLNITGQYIESESGITV